VTTNYSARIPRLARAVALPLIGTVLFGIGVGLRVWAALHRSFGWYAYVPLSAARFDPFASSGIDGWGSGLITAGLVVLAFWVGLLFGTRRKALR
jgi:heme/copper-type cytochrome/quinol oxidase subunit 1